MCCKIEYELEITSLVIDSGGVSGNAGRGRSNHVDRHGGLLRSGTLTTRYLEAIASVGRVSHLSASELEVFRI